VPERARRLTRISPDLISVAACRVLHVRFPPSVFPSSSSPSSLPSPSTPPLFNHHGHLLFYTVIAEARHGASRLHTHRSHRLARHNRNSTITTHLPSVTPNRERATTAWYTNWILGTSLQASQDAFRPYSCRFGHHCDRGLRPVQILRQRVLWLVFSGTLQYPQQSQGCSLVHQEAWVGGFACSSLTVRDEVFLSCLISSEH
jgi:hypothetical protein